MIFSNKYSFPMGSLAISTALLNPVAVVARAEVYLSPEQAAQITFPGVKLSRREIILSDEQINLIEKKADISVPNKNMVLFVGPGGEVVFIDKVLGKHELITFSVGIKGGAVNGVEILEYHETYGYQVRNEAWRKQFVGKDKTAPLKLEADIKNISGATLSSAHVTAGVKRLVHTYESIRQNL